MPSPYSNPSVPEGSLVLISGVNGFIASHVADQFLNIGYKVRGTVRDQSKAQWVSDMFKERHPNGHFETVVVADMTTEGAFDEAVKGCGAFVHMASIVNFEKDPNKVIPVVKGGMDNALRAAIREPAVKRFVYTSSSTAAMSPVPNKEINVTEETWNEESIKAVWSEPYNPWATYSASKTEAEKEAWRFYRAEKPNFVLNTVLPNANFGLILSKEQPASTAAWIKAVFQNQFNETLKSVPPQYFVDVQDDAKIHVAATLNPDVKEERLFAYAEPYSWNRIFDSLHKLYPNQKLPDRIPNEGQDLTKVPNGKAEQLLKDFGQSGWTSFEASLKNNVAGLVEA